MFFNGMMGVIQPHTKQVGHEMTVSSSQVRVADNSSSKYCQISNNNSK